MRYVALVGLSALRRVEAIVSTAGTVVPAHDVTGLLAGMGKVLGVCVVVDPALLTTHDVGALVRQFDWTPQPIVAYVSAVREALETSVLLAQGTTAQFVFQGMADEATVLRQTLLLAPDARLGHVLTAALASQLNALPHQLRDAVVALLRTGVGPHTADALATQGGVPRRSMDRAFEVAGLESSRFVIGAAQVVRVYRAVAHSRIALGRIAAMAGYASQRTLDHHFHALLGVPTRAIRECPLSVEAVTERLATRLTTRFGQSAGAADHGAHARLQIASAAVPPILHTPTNGQRHVR